MNPIFTQLSLQHNACQKGGNRRGRTLPRAPPNYNGFGSFHGEEDTSESFNDSYRKKIPF